MIAHALMEMTEAAKGVEDSSAFMSACELHVYGVDMATGGEYAAQRPSCEYLLGIAHARGIKTEVPVETTLLDACVPASEKPYGYDSEDVEIKWEDGRAIVTRTPREELPSAEEIEHRYRRVK